MGASGVFSDPAFLSQLVATLIGVLFAVIGGGVITLWIQQRMKESTVNEIIKNTIISIREELEDAKKGVEKFKKNPVKWDKSWKFDGEKPWILKPAYDSAVNSGNFTLLEKSLQKDIPSAYLSIDVIDFYSERIRRFVYEPLGARGNANIIADELCAKLEKNVKALDEKLEKLLPKLITAGLERVNISLDTLDPKKFLEITQREMFDKTMAGIEAALQSPLKVKINAVALKNFNDSEIIDFVKFAKSLP